MDSRVVTIRFMRDLLEYALPGVVPLRTSSLLRSLLLLGYLASSILAVNELALVTTSWPGTTRPILIKSADGQSDAGSPNGPLPNRFGWLPASMFCPRFQTKAQCRS